MEEDDDLRKGKILSSASTAFQTTWLIVGSFSLYFHHWHIAQSQRFFFPQFFKWMLWGPLRFLFLTLASVHYLVLIHTAYVYIFSQQRDLQIGPWRLTLLQRLWRWFCHITIWVHRNKGFPSSSVVKEFACNEGDLGSIPGSGRSPGEGNGNPLQYSCLENPMDRGAWGARV